ncbi:MAG TPA: hypothetical protein VJK72_04065 [Candidatus Nanoarchaeia archaeon]|nr:hypothetical protein [Candidatus Nanoarchaeia archaeon]
MKHFLITRPYHDRPTSYLHSFSRAIVTIARAELNLRVSELEGIKAQRKNLEVALSTKDPTFVFLNGHGDEESVWGNKDKVLLDRKNIHLTANMIVYALACKSLVSLGKESILSGTRAYVGYRDEYMCVGEVSKSSVPDKDKNAAPFRKVNHILIYALLTGTKVSIAIERAKKEYVKLIKTYGSSEDDPFGDAPAIRFALSWDLLGLDVAGDKSATF